MNHDPCSWGDALTFHVLDMEAVFCWKCEYIYKDLRYVFGLYATCLLADMNYIILFICFLIIILLA